MKKTKTEVLYSDDYASLTLKKMTELLLIKILH
jgi:hypothetical protein